MKQYLTRIKGWFREQVDLVQLKFRKPDYGPKIFCIGFNKTGTTTLGKSLEMLGYRNSSFNKRVWRNYYQQGKIEAILDYTAKFDSVDDLPWLKEDMIPILDKRFPGSKFIYLERDEQTWKKSLHNWTYKVTGDYPDVDQRLEDFRAHRTFVSEYFKDRADQDFISLNIQDPVGFEKLANFLRRKAPQTAFPHFNKTNGQ